MQKYILTIIFLQIAFLSYAQWQQIDRLETEKQYEKALELTEKIYQKADSAGNQQELYKSILYQVKYKSLLNTPMPEIISFTEKEADKAKTPLKNFLHSLIVDLYLNYYQNNYRRIQDNWCMENIACNSMEDWSVERLQKTILQHIALSLTLQKELQNLKISAWNKIIIQGNIDSLTPSVYDFLSYKALDFLSNKEWKPLNADTVFSLPDSLFLLPAQKFIDIKNSSQLSTNHLKLKIYQDLLQEHLNTNNDKALIYAEIHRIKSIRDNEKLYENALQKMISVYDNYSCNSEFYYLLANYHALNQNKAIALALCNRAIKKYPDSFGAKQCAHLKSKILNAELSFSVKNIVTAKDSFSVFVQYKNIDTVYVKIAQISNSAFEKLKNEHYGKKLYNKLLQTSKTIQLSTHKLPNNNDYESHTAELRLPSPAYGKYIVFVANNKRFDYQNNITTYADFQSTNLNYISKQMSDGSRSFYVLNRKTAEPLKNVQVKIYTKNKNFITGTSENRLIKSVFTDKNGYFMLKADEKTALKELYIEFRKNNDVLSTQKPLLLYPIDNQKNDGIKIYFITDKNNYLPGEKIYFKAFVSQNAKLISGFKTLLILNAGKEKITEKTFTSSESGTFYSELNIPETVKANELEIYTPLGSKIVKLKHDENIENKQLIIEDNKAGTKLPFIIEKSILSDSLIISIKSIEKKQKLLFELTENNNLVENKWITINNKATKLIIPIKDSSVLKLSFTAVRNSQLFTHTEEFNQYCLNKNLNLEVNNSGNLHVSGSDTQWKLHLTDKANKPVKAELMFWLTEDSSTITPGLNKVFCPQNQNSSSWKLFKTQSHRAKVLSKDFHWFIPLPFRQNNYLNLYGFRFPKESSYYQFQTGENTISENHSPQSIKTAYFFPALKTNSQGDIQLDLSIPKSENIWYIKMLAHDKNMQFVQTTKALSIKKMLKIELQNPQFYRQGDMPVLSTKIINNSEQTIEGTVHLYLYQNGSSKILLENESATKNFNIIPGEYKQVFWDIQIPENISILRYKVEAKSGKHIDIQRDNIKIINTRTELSCYTKPHLRTKNISDNDTLKLDKYNNNFTNQALQKAMILSKTLSQNSIDYLQKYFAALILNNQELKHKSLTELLQYQNKNGAWKWFPEMPEDDEISCSLLTGFGRLKNLALIDIENDLQIRRILLRSIWYLDHNATNLTLASTLHYLYARSYFPEISFATEDSLKIQKYKPELIKSANKLDFNEKLMLAITAKRFEWNLPEKYSAKLNKQIESEKYSSSSLPLIIEFLNTQKVPKEKINQYKKTLSINCSNTISENAIYALLLNEDKTENINLEKIRSINLNQTKVKTGIRIKTEYYFQGSKERKLSRQGQLFSNDTLIVRISVQTKKTVKFLKISDYYASLFEPELVKAYSTKNGINDYQSKGFDSMDFYVQKLDKGTYTFEYKLIAKHKGTAASAGTTIKQLFQPQKYAENKGRSFIVR